MMKETQIDLDLGAVQKTLLLPLWARAKETERKEPILIDPYAKEIIQKVAYDFSIFEAEIVEMEQINFAVRALNFENEIKKFIKNQPDSIILNVGAGLDTTFQRIDNGRIMWVNIDLPDVAALRQEIIPDSEREITIGKSVFDDS